MLLRGRGSALFKVACPVRDGSEFGYSGFGVYALPHCALFSERGWLLSLASWDFPWRRIWEMTQFEVSENECVWAPCWSPLSLTTIWRIHTTRKAIMPMVMDYFSERIHIRISQAKRGIWLSPGETKHELLAVPSLWSCMEKSLSLPEDIMHYKVLPTGVPTGASYSWFTGVSPVGMEHPCDWIWPPVSTPPHLPLQKLS